jgi:hypothetical protein
VPAGREAVDRHALEPADYIRTYYERIPFRDGSSRPTATAGT